jgi:ATP-binding cassette subfamily D (ALD) long-chain fatty acid import protein
VRNSLNANAIPVGVWMLIQTICDRTLQQKVRSVIASYEKQDGTFDVGGLVTHPLLKSIFLETLRFSVGSPSIRIVRETTELAGYTFHKGNIVCIPTRELQMDAKIWSPGGILPHPSRFWAGRFLDLEKNEDGDAERVAEALEANAQYVTGQGSVATPSPTSDRGHCKLSTDPLSAPGSQSKTVRDRMQSMRPFGGGISLCPGRHFAMYETIAGLAIILSTFDFEVDQAALRLNGMPSPQLGVIGGMGPDRKLIVRMRRRKGRRVFA